ncbi:sodium/potassium/calcium exchanger 5 isoform X2 [Ixodes scapularis]|uniref:sodium/potassium/calcium exchanger 5 isoform X2 n=1 Tax=Ixodes scapularis TaxID=6945 RepID=UPI001A9E2D1D|nr:sodium/potassium/calcium exchanger 5 isoform X2 [Ixodes scapularis]
MGHEWPASKGLGIRMVGGATGRVCVLATASLLLATLFSDSACGETIDQDGNITTVWELPGLHQDVTTKRYNGSQTLGLYTVAGNSSADNVTEFCVPPSIYEFPDDPFTQQERLRGWVAVHFGVLAYLCCMLAIVCDVYFVPCLELLSNALKISSDVAGATVMAVGTSSPELYSAIIGSFVTEGDIGVGAIVGSAVFNILGVTSVTGIYLLTTTVQLEWYPIVRDSLLYIASVSVLAACIADSTVYWYEAAVLLMLFCVYILVMHYNSRLKQVTVDQMDRLIRCIKSRMIKNGEKNNSKVVSQKVNIAPAEVMSLLLPSEKNDASRNTPDTTGSTGYRVVVMDPKTDLEDTSTITEIKVPALDPSTSAKGERNWMERAWWLVMLPASVLLCLTIPNCKRWPRMYPLSFLMSVVWIGLLSYLCAWMVTVIGYTLDIPDSVSGLTILAAGISVPEIITSVLIVKMGFGNMAFSNLIGSNIFDILFCLGFPWLVKTLSHSSTGSLHINSGALTYTTLTLLATTVLMLVTLCASRWRLNWKVGIVCLVLYVAFIVLACCYELNFFGQFNPPTCAE